MSQEQQELPNMHIMGLEVLPVYKLYVCEGEMTNFAIELSLPLAVY